VLSKSLNEEKILLFVQTLLPLNTINMYYSLILLVVFIEFILFHEQVEKVSNRSSNSNKIMSRSIQIVFILGYADKRRTSFSISIMYCSCYQVEKNQSSYTGQMAPRSMRCPWKKWLVLGMAHTPNICALGFFSLRTPRTPVGLKSHSLFSSAEVIL